MKALTINLPEQFDKKEVLLTISAQLYQQGALSANQATDLAGVTMNELIHHSLPESDSLKKYLEPGKEYISTEEWIEDLKAQQNYKEFNQNEFEKFASDLDIQEPLEDLLSQLTK
ncbi:hypothetical protein FEM33_22430 [Dyadobacter flavalbus]|uniref:Uncharacterized protein n=1 Tax=Dyadobacter flavalbus TaxID=2579942 RepID=A0A5M8QGE9_9BACT|nr:hypothetical protein [Dyadobacter flavalbus]KAA6434044.1 hypothetical protein FEM33_22430 [Dyadobacter flavalbus]